MIRSSWPGLDKGQGIVVDVGAGTGVLSLLALKHGYEHAFLIEPSENLAQYRNGMSGRFTILQAPTAPSPQMRSSSMLIEYRGMIAWFTIDLAANGKTVLASNDPRVFAWKPHYLPMKSPLRVRRGQKVRPELLLRPVDAPYKYAFQFQDSNSGPC